MRWSMGIGVRNQKQFQTHRHWKHFKVPNNECTTIWFIKHKPIVLDRTDGQWISHRIVTPNYLGLYSIGPTHRMSPKIQWSQQRWQFLLRSGNAKILSICSPFSESLQNVWANEFNYLFITLELHQCVNVLEMQQSNRDITYASDT